MASANRSVSLVVIVISLLVAGGLLFAAVRELSAELEHDERYGGAFSAIHLAAEDGAAAAVRRELEKGVDVDVRRDGGEPWKLGMTPLMEAVIYVSDGPSRDVFERLTKTCEDFGQDQPEIRKLS